MIAFLKPKSVEHTNPVISITGSKSESNRLLILQALFPQLVIHNLSESDDTVVLQKCLNKNNGILDIHHAGTAMRFLTAYYATRKQADVTLTGSERMQQRPIKILVDALEQLGASIEYLKNVGYPPIRIKGTQITNDIVSIKANVSSQYISALMLIAPSLTTGLKIELVGECTSVPYINMSLSLLQKIGANAKFTDNIITISPLESPSKQSIVVESDWSSASYFYSIMALTETPLNDDKTTSVTLKSFKAYSLQGDADIAVIYRQFGVETTYNSNDNIIILKKHNIILPESVSLHLTNTPDIAQTIAVTCFGLGLSCHLTGLHTLKIKETDRLSALKVELEKFGAKVSITEDSLTLKPAQITTEEVVVETYNDHRMAMAFAPLAKCFPLRISDPMVVTKSFPTFWKDIKKLGISVGLQ